MQHHCHGGVLGPASLPEPYRAGLAPPGSRLALRSPGPGALCWLCLRVCPVPCYAVGSHPERRRTSSLVDKNCTVHPLPKGCGELFQIKCPSHVRFTVWKHIFQTGVGLCCETLAFFFPLALALPCRDGVSPAVTHVPSSLSPLDSAVHTMVVCLG